MDIFIQLFIVYLQLYYIKEGQSRNKLLVELNMERVSKSLTSRY